MLFHFLSANYSHYVHDFYLVIYGTAFEDDGSALTDTIIDHAELDAACRSFL